MRQGSTFARGAGSLLLALLAVGGASGKEEGVVQTDATDATESKPAGTAVALFGTGCFWCSEAVFEHVTGVQSVQSGYAGGSVKNPTYKQVCSGTTGHAEVVRVEYDPAVVRYEDLLDLFWQMHDPTTPNRQGADVGTQYRSVIFYQTPEQKLSAETSKQKLDASGRFKDPIVTEIAPAPEFYPAEDYHQDYFKQNRNAPYCRIVIQPKLKKLKLEP